MEILLNILLICLPFLGSGFVGIGLILIFNKQENALLYLFIGILITILWIAIGYGQQYVSQHF